MREWLLSSTQKILILDILVKIFYCKFYLQKSLHSCDDFYLEVISVPIFLLIKYWFELLWNLFLRYHSSFLLEYPVYINYSMAFFGYTHSLEAHYLIVRLFLISVIAFIEPFWSKRRYYALREVFLFHKFSSIGKHDGNFRSLRQCTRWRNFTFKPEI